MVIEMTRKEVERYGQSIISLCGGSGRMWDNLICRQNAVSVTTCADKTDWKIGIGTWFSDF